MGSCTTLHPSWQLIDTIEEGEAVCAKLREETILGLDCEGVNLGPTGNLTLAQISTPTGKVYLFDIGKCPGLIVILRDILESSTILKIIHDCRGERSNLRKQFGIDLRNVFDTQIAFHFLKPFKNDRISLTNLSKYYRVPPNALKGEFQSDFYDANPDFWARRPLSEKMIAYASADVANLHLFYGKLKVYEWNSEFRRRCEIANVTEADLIDEDGGGRNPKLRYFS